MRLLVVGGVAAGLSAAARARRIDRSLEILVLEKGDTISYGACGLPYFVEGRVRRAEQLVVYTPEYFRKERNISVRTGAHVAAIAHARREVALETGERVHYDRLVIATGARPARSAELPHVFHLHTLDDARRLKDFLAERKPRRAMVVGAGYIGLEAADALRRHGIRVEVFDRGANVLGRDDPELTATVCRHLQRFRVELHCGQSTLPKLEDYDVVVMATGIRPNVEIAAEAGVELGRTGAIRVDERMQTNQSGIFAAGDCVETTHLVTGRPVWIPLGTTANKMGRVAGANAAGARERFPGVVGTSILSVFDLGIASTGLSVEHARREGFAPVAARIEGRSRAGYFPGAQVSVELVADRGTGRLLGGTVIGEQDAATRVNVIAAALHARLRVEEFENLDLAYAPPYAPVWDPLLIAAQQLMKLMRQ